MRNLIDNIWPTDGSIKTLCDLGAGDGWFTTQLPGVEEHIAVDIWQPYLDKFKEKNIPNVKTFCMDIREYIRLKADASVDACLAIDVVEHFSEDQARFLISQMVRTAKRLVIIWTTLGFIEQGNYDNNGEPNPFQKHLCGPMPDWFPIEEGWKVDLYPEWHGARGGGLFAYKFNELKQESNFVL